MTPTTELTVAVDFAALARAVVVVDATPEARGLWGGPFPSVLEELAARLGGTDRPGVAFLGGPAVHALDDVLAAAAGRAGPVDLRRELGRGPALGPSLLPALDPPRPVLVVLGDTDPVDAADWAECGAVRPAVLRVAGPARLAVSGWAEFDAAADFDVLAERLRDPVTAVDVGGPGCVAVGWDAPGLAWDAGRLRGRPTGGVVARFLLPPGGTVTAAATRAGGWSGPVPTAAADLPPDPPAVPVSPAHAAVLRAWAAGKGFYCGGCRRSHPPGRAGCEAGGLFPGLAPGVYEADPAGAGWAARPRPAGVAVLADGRVLRAGDGPPRLFAPAADGTLAATADDPAGELPTVGGGFALVVG